jgi:hypothetical protein
MRGSRALAENESDIWRGFNVDPMSNEEGGFQNGKPV